MLVLFRVGLWGPERGRALTKATRCLWLSWAQTPLSASGWLLPKFLVPAPSPCGSLRMAVLRVMPEMPKPHRKRKTV